ncbi:hypothetical protein EJ02DRAFT_213633 [Clathrospora elynae]|uniref:Uncharacterized protein n=1 Tax=Clathrospora elynae TaxID=706981 RepID=A0A6A5SMR1_9PLEO|nr:hypothetical protein EJ02DRAFT_213633 [Clathrospora elynae]
MQAQNCRREREYSGGPSRGREATLAKCPGTFACSIQTSEIWYWCRPVRRLAGVRLVLVCLAFCRPVVFLQRVAGLVAGRH